MRIYHDHRVRTLGVLALIAAAAGCTGHGKYTGEFKKQSEQRMAAMKAATEWDMAQQQFLAGDLTKALRSIDNSISMNESVAKSHVLKGRILIEDGKLEAALASLERAVEIDPEVADAYYYQGVVYERFSDAESALTQFLAAHEHDSTNPQYPLAAAEMHVELRQYDEAVELLEQGRSSFRHNAGIRQTLAHIALIRQDVELAIELFQEATLLAPDDETLVEDLARAQFRAEQYVESEFNINRLRRMEGYADRRDLKHLHAKLLYELDRPVEARTVLRTLLDGGGGGSDTEAWVGLAEVALRMKDWREVKNCASRLIGTAPHQGDGFLYMALWQRNEGDLQGALGSLEKASKRIETSARAEVLQALVYMELNQPEQAQRSLAKGLLKEPNSDIAMRMTQWIELQPAQVITEVPIADDMR